ncbi:MAG: glycerol-3-phosphate 1-O-acyltransferase PlsY [Alphaproteobacteria bacterium]|nr:glycerol-3-phosphate 1-O-acyltransferase PlsY [Alphaproteobacteria bacterium]MBQ3117612.1 glycerol-3-phosphate 1-O-acyltransferase PlsY [Alphaproteobacteria bacterium]MBQ6854141.1 glycerol-3-phosphate 1-O-acyltransferase PlsY [Alphaproteobacteria bacterium]
MIHYIIAGICGYLLGSIPFGLVFTKMAGLGDIRQIGSGNIGATNVLRTGRKDLALATLLCDIGKAALVALVFKWMYESQLIGVVAGVAAVLGHNYSVWLKFKGGKGVASTLGLLLAMTPLVGVLTALTWLLTAVVFRYSSLAALNALTMAPIYSLFIENDKKIAGVYLLLTLLSFYRHRSNIKRLIRGEESKIRFKKK